MIYEFTLHVPYQFIDETVEQLNRNNIYNLYFDVPIEVTKIENGFGIHERIDEQIQLKIYANDEVNKHLPEHYVHIFKEILGIPKEKVSFHTYEEENYLFQLDDIDLDNGWVISYSNQSYPNHKILHLDPKMAFGTGLHETTQDCLKIILETNFKGMKVADLGTGTGILSIAAALKEAKKILAVDIEPVKEEILNNARLNNVSLEVKQADLLLDRQVVDEEYNFVIINIGANETIEIINTHKLFNKGIDRFLISGLVEWNFHKIVTFFNKNQFIVEKKVQSNDWVTILFKKNSTI